MSRVEDDFWKVFDLRVNNCGREQCKEVIMELSDKFPDLDFGNVSTGFINVDNVKKAISNMLSTNCE